MPPVIDKIEDSSIPYDIHSYLGLAGGHDVDGVVERLLDRRTADQDAMIPQKHHLGKHKMATAVKCCK